MYAIRNIHGHLADVKPYKVMVEPGLLARADAASCDLVEVDVIVRGVVPKTPVLKGKKK